MLSKLLNSHSRRVFTPTKNSARAASSTTIGIRREDGVLWERRAPFTPEQIRDLKKEHPKVDVFIQPSKQRIFTEEEYEKAGAVVREDLKNCDTIIGVKAVPIEQIHENTTYLFFSHTIKAQPANMDLLDTCINKSARLVDYEKIQEHGFGKRLVAFGKWAGTVGAIDICNALGMRLLAKGLDTPFLKIGRAHNYSSVDECFNFLKSDVQPCLKQLQGRLDKPITVIFTGNGNVSKGAQEVFHQMGIEMVKPEKLAGVKNGGDPTKIYGTVIDAKDHLINRKSGKFCGFKDLAENPGDYDSVFAEKFAPDCDVLVNGIVWLPGQPKLLTNADLKKLPNLLAVSDVSADADGSLEFMKKVTTLDHPYKFFDTDKMHPTDDIKSENGFIYCSVDNMPTQVAKEATAWFGSGLLPLVGSILEASDKEKNLQQLQFSGVKQEILKAIITSDGALAPDYEYIKKLRAQNVIASGQKSALVLGAGMVTGPLVEYLHKAGVKLTLASAYLDEVNQLIDRCGATGAKSVSVDLGSETEKLEQLIDSHDVVISLVPYTLHHIVAQAAIKTKTNMVTASYLSPALKDLEEEAKAAGIFVLNELGLDPGIDHMLAMECFDEIKATSGNDIKSFISFCGGLPAPEASNNALRYKFSWSPRGVLMAARNPAIYDLNNERKEIAAGGEILKQRMPVNFYPGFELEAIANRDSTTYREPYKLHKAETLLRGTLRFSPFCDVVYGLQEIGLCNMEQAMPENATTWQQVLDALNYKEKLSANVKIEQNIVLTAMEELSLFSGDPLSAKVKSADNILDAFANHLSENLVYKEKERDLVALRHEIIEHNNDNEKHVIDFVHYGDPNGWSAMAKTVALPAAIGARMALEGGLDGKTGMLRPLEQDIYKPVLAELRRLGLFSLYSREKNCTQKTDEKKETTN